MSDYVISQREFYTDGGQASPAVFKNLGRYQDLTFYGTTITKVEVSADGIAYYDVTADSGVVDLSVTGLAVVKDVCFLLYRITGTGTIKVTAN